MEPVQLASGRWLVRASHRGRRKSTTAPTRVAAQIAYGRLLAELGSPASTSTVTVGELITRRLARGRLSPTTAADWEAILRKLDVTGVDLAGRPAGAVTAAELDELYGRLEAAGWTVYRIRRLHEVLSASYRHAVRLGVLDDTPTRNVSPPAPAPAQVRPPAPDAIRRLFDAVGPELALFFRLAASTGARRGELVALQWADVDLWSGTITVRRSLVQVAGSRPTERPTKTGQKGHRRVSVGDPVRAAIGAHRTAQANLATSQGLPAPVWLFSSDAGVSPWRPDYPTRVLGRLRRAGKVSAFRLHDLRHYVATAMLADGVPATQVAGRLGHSTPAVTLRTYAHFLEAADREAAHRLDAKMGDFSPKSVRDSCKQSHDDRDGR
jgi:integrase